jgi:hypothetical protein
MFVQSLCDVHIEKLKHMIHEIISKFQNCIDSNNIVYFKFDILQQIEEMETFVDNIKIHFLSEKALQKLQYITIYDINILHRIVSHHYPSESKINTLVNKLQKFI